MTTLSVPPCDAMTDNKLLLLAEEAKEYCDEEYINGWVNSFIIMDGITVEEIAEFILAATPDKIICLLKRIEGLKENAERYQWLREQQWYNSNMFVIAGSKAQLKLGTDCPSLDRLDALIDEARGKK